MVTKISSFVGADGSFNLLEYTAGPELDQALDDMTDKSMFDEHLGLTVKPAKKTGPPSVPPSSQPGTNPPTPVTPATASKPSTPVPSPSVTNIRTSNAPTPPVPTPGEAGGSKAATPIPSAPSTPGVPSPAQIQPSPKTVKPVEVSTDKEKAIPQVDGAWDEDVEMSEESSTSSFHKLHPILSYHLTEEQELVDIFKLHSEKDQYSSYRLWQCDGTGDDSPNAGKNLFVTPHRRVFICS